MLTTCRTRKDAVLPLSAPITGVDGSTISEILVPKDTAIMVGIFSSNRNKAVWGEDAREWKPERWLSGLPESVSEAKIPGVYSNLYVYEYHAIRIHGLLGVRRMTFLGGGRACMFVLLFFQLNFVMH